MTRRRVKPRRGGTALTPHGAVQDPSASNRLTAIGSQQRFFLQRHQNLHRPLSFAPLGRQFTVRYNKFRIYSNHHAIREVYIQHHQHGDQRHHAACSWVHIPGNYQHHPCESKHVRYVRKVHFSKAEKKQSEY